MLPLFWCVFYCFALFCLNPSPVSWPEVLYNILARRDSEVAGLRRKHNKLSSKLSTKVPKSENERYFTNIQPDLTPKWKR